MYISIYTVTDGSQLRHLVHMKSDTGRRSKEAFERWMEGIDPAENEDYLHDVVVVIVENDDDYSFCAMTQ